MTVVKLIETFTEAVKQRRLLPSEGVLVVGVSGGTDSLALLHLLVATREYFGVKLHAATLNHGLRGDAGADDARFVVETAQAWGVPVTADAVDVRALAAARGIGIEAAARLARYDFLASVAREVGAERVAVAHNADDQVETVLLHLLRGSGIGGLAGMGYSAPMPGYPDLTLIRPLLGVPRADLDAYCRENGLTPRHDATNEDTSYTRNRLRREALPYLRALSPRIDRRLLQLAEIAALEDEFVDQALHAAVAPRVVLRKTQVALPREVFVTLHPVLQRRFVVWAARYCGEAAEVDFEHAVAAVELALRGHSGARAQFKGGIQLRNEYGWIIVERTDVPTSDDLPLVHDDYAVPILVPGVIPLNSTWSLGVSLDSDKNDSARLAIPEGSAIVLRGWREGDQFRAIYAYGGSERRRSVHTKKLAAWMVDHKVPRQIRRRLPIILVDDVVAAVWWKGWTVADQFAVRPDSTRVIYFLLNRK